MVSNEKRFTDRANDNFYGTIRIMERRRYDTELLAKIHEHLDELKALRDSCDSHWVGEDAVYRFWHRSFKVYGLQDVTLRIVGKLKALCPHNSSLNPWFVDIIDVGTGKSFEPAHNQAWVENTRPIVDAYFHARFMLDMVVKYGQELDEAPNVLPSGWATVLELYQIR